MLRHGILGLLNYGSMTGYDIVGVFKASLGYFWHAQTSQIYRELQTIKSYGWATDETIFQDGRPDKKLFTITESGGEELRKWLEDDNIKVEIRSPLMMKTFFRGESGIDENIRFFEKLCDESRAFDSKLSLAPSATEKYAESIGDPVKALYWRMTIEYGIMFSQMQRQWAENCIRQLEELKHEDPGDQRKSEG